MDATNKPWKTAILVHRKMAESIFTPDDLAFLSSFAEVNPAEELPEAMTLDFMEKALIDADACITCWGTPGFTDKIITDAKKLRLIAHAAGSVKALVPPGFWGTGCRITSNAPIIAEDVAQTVLALVLCSLRGLWGFAESTRRGEWSGGEASLFATRRLNGLQVGIVGGSNVGREVIKILKPFGCNIKLSDPYVSPLEAACLGAELTALNDLIASCDIISLHAPATEDSRHIINKENAPLIKDGALFINTARGMLVDEAALIKELKTGRFFACLDVTDPEPPALDHPFRRMENVILTPHIAGGHTVNGRLMLGRNSIKEVYNFLRKGLLSYEVRQEMLEHMA